MLLHCIAFGLDVNPNTRNEGRFILKVMKRASFLRSPTPLIMHDKVEVHRVLCVICAFINIVQACPFGHHALRCVIGGSRAEHYTPLSLRHHKECSYTHISLQIHCHYSVCALLQQKEKLQEAVADQPSKLPTGHQGCRPTIRIGR